MVDTPSDKVIFARTVAPYRSLPPRCLTWIMLGLAGFGFCSGIGFVLAGAWPVTGFFGLDIALLYLAFRLSYRSARQRENLRLTSQALDIERIGIHGERQSWQLEPTWLRVTIDENARGHGRLLVSSRGKTVGLGAFLNTEERRRLADELKAALRRWRDSLRG
ncbi:MAG TPA: DUF2244 domain-containing protein [Stellaceae bacterium]|jgi:uncharacterized membrane protein|nr:DUF2244 domain-containing protein [Stellaceae bacterium]